MDLQILGLPIPSFVKGFCAIVTYISIFWFIFRLCQTLRKSWKKILSNEGNLPLLGFVYTLFTIYFIVSLAQNFDCIIESYQNVVNVAFSECKDCLGDGVVLQLFTFLPITSILVAFTFNISKSFYTITCLEFGFFQGVDRIGEILKSPTTKFSSTINLILRGIGASLFVVIEQFLSRIVDFREFETVSIFIFFLYLSIIIWAFHISYLDRKRVKNNTKLNRVCKLHWTGKTQYFAGLVMATFLIVYTRHLESGMILVISTTAIVFIGAFLVVISIVTNEILMLRGKLHGS